MTFDSNGKPLHIK